MAYFVWLKNNFRHIVYASLAGVSIMQMIFACIWGFEPAPFFIFLGILAATLFFCGLFERHWKEKRGIKYPTYWYRFIFVILAFPAMIFSYFSLAILMPAIGDYKYYSAATSHEEIACIVTIERGGIGFNAVGEESEYNKNGGGCWFSLLNENRAEANKNGMAGTLREGDAVTVKGAPRPIQGRMVIAISEIRTDKQVFLDFGTGIKNLQKELPKTRLEFYLMFFIAFPTLAGSIFLYIWLGHLQKKAQARGNIEGDNLDYATGT
ncbi:MAG: hypothetical protein FWD58_10150 [Firmicutes bacterium]|nr:hypothetical protein [Bacillota bacterium]